MILVHGKLPSLNGLTCKINIPLCIKLDSSFTREIYSLESNSWVKRRKKSFVLNKCIFNEVIVHVTTTIKKWWHGWIPPSNLCFVQLNHCYRKMLQSQVNYTKQNTKQTYSKVVCIVPKKSRRCSKYINFLIY